MVVQRHGLDAEPLCDIAHLLEEARLVAFKLIESAWARGRAVNAPHLVALVRARVKFRKGKIIERPELSRSSQQLH
ncbi:hypothetical protein [Nonomuraea sp. NPDC049400]|uniref:hypothetical protein n=1 Tax=Nonomuraea sp. NPDC049400 TaxID=3364352 RepID=UPI00378E3B0E